MDASTINQAEKVAERQKQAGADQIDGMAKAVHDAATQLQDQMPQAAELVHAAAARMERGAGLLRDSSVQDLANGLSDFGRREPLALFGGAMIAGFALSRFLKSGLDNAR